MLPPAFRWKEGAYGRTREVTMRIKTAIMAMGLVFAATRGAQAVTVQKSTFKNTQISLFTSLETTIDCGNGTTSTATAFVFLSGGSFVNPFGTGTGTSVDVFGFSNGCTGQSFGDAEGFIQGGVIGPNQPLTSAELTGSVNANVDFGAGGTVPVSLDLTFTGNGPLSASRDTTETKTATTPSGPFTITIQRGAFRNRSADVTGTITIDGVVFPVDVTNGATLLDNNSTTITVDKP
jgi:hypothetical protein